MRCCSDSVSSPNPKSSLMSFCWCSVSASSPSGGAGEEPSWRFLSFCTSKLTRLLLVLLTSSPKRTPWGLPLFSAVRMRLGFATSTCWRVRRLMNALRTFLIGIIMVVVPPSSSDSQSTNWKDSVCRNISDSLSWALLLRTTSGFLGAGRALPPGPTVCPSGASGLVGSSGWQKPGGRSKDPTRRRWVGDLDRRSPSFARWRTMAKGDCAPQRLWCVMGGECCERGGEEMSPPSNDNSSSVDLPAAECAFEENELNERGGLPRRLDDDPLSFLIFIAASTGEIAGVLPLIGLPRENDDPSRFLPALCPIGDTTPPRTPAYGVPTCDMSNMASPINDARLPVHIDETESVGDSDRGGGEFAPGLNDECHRWSESADAPFTACRMRGDTARRRGADREDWAGWVSRRSSLGILSTPSGVAARALRHEGRSRPRDGAQTGASG
mmetsp:Transcript_30276/g.70709  ORF Transcript_30276/g.70709 Transcript_30276/m.70709 type:complete len:440 (-) Transcript_30276:334-1653(-)